MNFQPLAVQGVVGSSFDGLALAGPALEVPTFGGPSLNLFTYYHCHRHSHVVAMDHGPAFEGPSFEGPGFDAPAFEDPSL